MLRNNKFARIALQIVGLALPPAFFYFFFRHADRRALLHALGSLDLGHAAGIVLLVSALPLLKTAQWKFLLNADAKVPFRSLYRTVSVWMMAYNVFPLWTGEVVAFFLLSRKDKVSKTAALSVLTLNQVCEGLSLALIFSVLAWAAAIPDWMRNGMKFILVLLALALFALLFVSMRHRSAPEGRKIQAGFWGRLRGHFHHWAYYLEPIRNPKKMIPALALTLAVRGIELAVLAVLERSFGLSLPFYSPFMVIAALHLAMLIPVSPGNLGVFEAAVFFVYRFLGVEDSLALALAISFHVFSVLPLVVQGYGFYLALGLKRKNWKPEAEASWPLLQPEV